MIIGLVTTLLGWIFGWIAKQIMKWFIPIYENMIYGGLCVEVLFKDVQSFKIAGLYQAIYTFAIALLIMFFVKRMIEVYFAWSNGDPETSPLSVLLGFVKALIVMICFGFIYETFVNVFVSMYNSFINAGFEGGASIEEELKYVSGVSGVFLNIIGNVFYCIIAIFCVLIYFQNLGRGIEMLVLRFGVPFACIGFLNADGGVANGYFQKMIKIGFTILVQILLLRLSLALLTKFHVILSLACINIAYKTPSLLSEFMVTSGGGYYGGRTAGSIINSGANVLSNLAGKKGK